MGVAYKAHTEVLFERNIERYQKYDFGQDSGGRCNYGGPDHHMYLEKIGSEIARRAVCGNVRRNITPRNFRKE